jgi:hypothetical protein
MEKMESYFERMVNCCSGYYSEFLRCSSKQAIDFIGIKTEIFTNFSTTMDTVNSYRVAYSSLLLATCYSEFSYFVRCIFATNEQARSNYILLEKA